MKQSDIGKLASEATRIQFADELSSFVTLTKEEISTLFPTAQDRKELGLLVDIVKNAANENQRKAKLISNITSVAGAVIKLLGTKVVPV